MILEIGVRRLTGVFHCCGRDATTRMDLARTTCAIFDLDAELLRTGAPDPEAMPGALIPYDTSLTSPRTSRLLRREPTGLGDLLERFRVEYEAAA